jgi:hypothetical protein
MLPDYQPEKKYAILLLPIKPDPYNRLDRGGFSLPAEN